MNETTNPYSTPNVARPNGDQRLRTPDIADPSSTGNASGVRPATASVHAPAASSVTTPAPAATPATAPGMAPRAAATVPPTPTATAAAAPAAEPTPPAAPALLEKVVQGAHATVDRLADSAAPTVQRISERVSATEEALHAGTDQMRQVRDDWAAGMRTTVRGNPLACVAGALALGALIARITR